MNASRHNVQPALQHLLVPISSLVPDPANPRKHDERSLQAIGEALARFGQDQPLVVQLPERIVRKGNGRLLAARRLGWTQIAAVLINEANREAIARGIADNRTAELSSWDTDILGEALRYLSDGGGGGEESGSVKPILSVLGFLPKQLDRLMGHTSERGNEFTVTAPALAESIAVTVEQEGSIMAAVEQLRREVGRHDLTVGRALELICVEWLQDAHRTS